MPIAQVTLLDNVEFDENNEPLIDENDNIVLKDPEVVGIYIKTHVIQAQAFDASTQTIQTGILPKAEVLWYHKRSPAPDLVDPETLFWINIFTDSLEDETDDADDADDEMTEEQIYS